ncbi:hypothetical protein JZ751_019685 [Albula glossodonta]|uniref:Carbonic anhydrase n=1 Tax=Albula glossodonta TaxID=121402 RepID=A0A8T2NMI8_9TELE|nr:hypothetical protein JZ751_019685 [Albula glossodonta]
MHCFYLQTSIIFQVWSFITISASYGAKWTYTGPDGEDHWYKHYPFCRGPFQSPIDFEPELLRYDPTLVPVEVRNYNLSSHEQLTLSNNGHSVQLSLPPRMQLSGLPHLYSAVQLHLHWGSPSLPPGSEHTVNGRRFAAELHVVHFNSDRYPNISMAADKSDGLAVLGVLIEIGEFNPAFNQFLKYLNGVKYKDQRIQISAFNIRGLLPAHLNEYYRYDGSLTTPPCYASVLWTVFKNPVTISEKQFLALATSVFSSSQQESAPVVLNGNYRKPQNSENRIVLVSFQEGLHGTPTVTPAHLRRKVIQHLLAGEPSDVDEEQLPPKFNQKQGPGKMWADRKSQNSLGPSAPKQKGQQSVKMGDGSSLGPTFRKNSKTASHMGKPGLFQDSLCYSTLEKKVYRQLKKANAEHQLAEALREVLFPELNVRSYLACRSELALPTIMFLLRGQPLEKAAELDNLPVKDNHRSKKRNTVNKLDPTHTTQAGQRQATIQKNTQNQARPRPVLLGWEWED